MELSATSSAAYAILNWFLASPFGSDPANTSIWLSICSMIAERAISFITASLFLEITPDHPEADAELPITRVTRFSAKVGKLEIRNICVNTIASTALPAPNANRMRATLAQA
jgi:hypothetical protein